MTFTPEQIKLLTAPYDKALNEVLTTHPHETNSPFFGIQEICEVLNLSADEVSLNKLDEDMTPAEYLLYGIESVQTEMIHHYESHGAVWKPNPNGIATLEIPENATPYPIPKEPVPDFSQDERRFVLNLLHLFLEQGTLSKEELLHQIGLD